MKTLLVLIAVIATFNTKAACELDLKIKKSGAKTFYLANGQKLTLKALSKFSGVCKFKTSLMSEREVKQMKILDLNNRLKKLQGGK